MRAPATAGKLRRRARRLAARHLVGLPDTQRDIKGSGGSGGGNGDGAVQAATCIYIAQDIDLRALFVAQARKPGPRPTWTG